MYRFLIATALIFTISAHPMSGQDLTIRKEKWGETTTGEEVYLFTMRNRQRLQVQIMTLGGIITSIKMPDKHGVIEEITLGFDDLDPYLRGHPKFGAVMGRVTNRIKNARFTLDGEVYELEKNAGEHHIHGGTNSFDKMLWQAHMFGDGGTVGINLTLHSASGDGGFPGMVDAHVQYTLNNKNQLTIRYKATTDKPTHVNMTNHAYFNLNGGKRDIYDHQIQINAEYYTEADDSAMPTGQILSVEDSPLDLRNLTRIGDRIDKLGPGFDHNYVIRKEPGLLGAAAAVTDPESGRKMEVFTTQPGVQFYSANWLQGKYVGKGGVAYQNHFGIALETQHFPASANYTHFPSTVLRPGEEYEEKTMFVFSLP